MYKEDFEKIYETYKLNIENLTNKNMELQEENEKLNKIANEFQNRIGKGISKDTILDIIEVIIKKKDFIINNINSDKDAWITFTNTEELKNRMIQIGIKVYLGDNND